MYIRTRAYHREVVFICCCVIASGAIFGLVWQNSVQAVERQVAAGMIEADALAVVTDGQQ